jgi:hypothetical protein
MPGHARDHTDIHRGCLTACRTGPEKVDWTNEKGLPIVLVQTGGDASQCDDCRARGVGERLRGRWGGVEFELSGIVLELHDS